jgi:hypothetical protein
VQTVAYPVLACPPPLTFYFVVIMFQDVTVHLMHLADTLCAIIPDLILSECHIPHLEFAALCSGILQDLSTLAWDKDS